MIRSFDIKISAGPLLNCPTCGLPAEITDRFVLDGVPTAVEHVELVCQEGLLQPAPRDRRGHPG
jgi:hypothetical protein